MILEQHRLLEHVVWRLETLTPLHAGSGDTLIKGLDVESKDGWTFVLDLERFCAAIPQSLWTNVAQEGIGEVYAGRPLRDVQQYAIKGELRGPSFRNGFTTLRTFARDAFGRPYLPGSVLKGAIRSALLAARLDQDPDVQNALHPHPESKRLDTKNADHSLQRAALRPGADARPTADLLRHLYIADVFVPPSSLEVVPVKIASMADPGHWAWKQKGRVNAQQSDDKGVLELFVEALRPGTVLRVPIRIDVRQLGPDRPAWQQFAAWRNLLTTDLLSSVRSLGQRVLQPELQMWNVSRPHTSVGEVLEALVKRVASSPHEAIFPIGWGIGWRGMTGALVERLGESADARNVDAEASDPAFLTEMRSAYKLGKRDFPIFPKSRKVALDAMPLGWMAMRLWADNDEATAFEPVKPPPGQLDQPVRPAPPEPHRPPVEQPTTVDTPAEQPQVQQQRPEPRVAPQRAPQRDRPPMRRGEKQPGQPMRPQASATDIRAGARVSCVLLEEKSKKGKWKAKTDRDAIGIIEPEGEPEAIAPDQVVELIVKNTAPLGQEWAFAWPKKAEDTGDAKKRKR